MIWVSLIDAENEMRTQKKIPDHVRLGYGSISVGEAVSFNMDAPPAVLRNRMSSYSNHSGKRFRTRTEGGVMHVERVK